MCAKPTLPSLLNFNAARLRDGTVRNKRDERMSHTSRPMMISFPAG